MRVLQLILVTVLVSKSVFSQKVPETPKTPSTYSSSTNTSSNSVTDGVVTSSSSSSSSVNISDTKKTYKFKSKFDTSKKQGIYEILKGELNTVELIEKGNEIIWKKSKNGMVIFECNLTKKSLNIVSNKKELSSGFNAKIYSLGEELSNFISGNNRIRIASTRRDAKTVSSAETRVEEAKAALERSIKNLERVKREN